MSEETAITLIVIPFFLQIIVLIVEYGIVAPAFRDRQIPKRSSNARIDRVHFDERKITSEGLQEATRIYRKIAVILLVTTSGVAGTALTRLISIAVYDPDSLDTFQFLCLGNLANSNAVFFFNSIVAIATSLIIALSFDGRLEQSGWHRFILSSIIGLLVGAFSFISGPVLVLVVLLLMFAFDIPSTLDQ